VRSRTGGDRVNIEIKVFQLVIIRRIELEMCKIKRINQPWSAKPPGTSLEKAWDSTTNFVSASRPDLVLSKTGRERVREAARK
jgi:hypothetical protein